MGAFTSMVRVVLGWVPTVTPPAFLSDAGGFLSTAGEWVGDTSAWIPWPFVGAVLLAWVVAIGAMVAIKGVRIVASFLTLGGGSAA